MMKKVVQFVGAIILAGVMSAASQSMVGFDDFEDGAIHKQKGWWSDKPEVASNAFFVVDCLGLTQSEGDKALVISKADDYVKVMRKNAVYWAPGETFVFELDFQLGLNPGPVEKPQNGLAILLGEPSLHTSSRWVLSLGINPENKWLIRGNLPHWENLPVLAPETFIARPESGDGKVSGWFHLKLTSVKGAERGVFKTKLVITDQNEKVIVEHSFNEEALTGEKAAVWDSPTVSYAFSAKDNINGLVCVDNVNLTSIAAPKKPQGLKDLL